MSLWTPLAIVALLFASSAAGLALSVSDESPAQQEGVAHIAAPSESSQELGPESQIPFGVSAANSRTFTFALAEPGTVIFMVKQLRYAVGFSMTLPDNCATLDVPGSVAYVSIAETIQAFCDLPAGTHQVRATSGGTASGLLHLVGATTSVA